MAHAGVLSVLELVAIVSCGYGLFALSSGIHLFGSLGLAYGSLWFLLGATSNICGLVGLCKAIYLHSSITFLQGFLQKFAT